MINIETMKFVIKALKKSDDVTIIHIATEEEQEYLKKYNIYTQVVVLKRPMLLCDAEIDQEYCRYYLKK